MKSIFKHILILGPMVGFAAMLTAGTAWAQETQTGDTAAQTTAQDSSKWGHETSDNPDVQNPPGYRGMERPVNVFPPDSARDTLTPGQVEDQVTGTYEDSAWQDTTGAVQNPAGYRGMERPVGGDTQSDTTSSDTASRAADTTSTTGAAASPKDTIRVGEPESTTPESPEAGMEDAGMEKDTTGHGEHSGEAQPADTSGY